MNKTVGITTEMRAAENQKLATRAHVDDFVIGPSFMCLLMAQISENPGVRPVIEELLDEAGSELYIKPAADYVSLGVPVNGYTLTESAARHGEIYIGYRKMETVAADVVVNPSKSDEIVFGEKDMIVVISDH